MNIVNIKEEVAELELKRKAGEPYETKVEVIETPVRHKHIFIPALNKHYVKDVNQNWYLQDNKCEICEGLWRAIAMTKPVR